MQCARGIFRRGPAGVALACASLLAWPLGAQRQAQPPQIGKDGLQYVYIPPGTFTMGCSPGDRACETNEKPPHRVAISKGFWMGQTEVTAGAYKRFAAAARRQMPQAPDYNAGWRNDNQPIMSVMWDDANAYCTWAGGRLPTEAEWEHAARGGSVKAHYGNLDDVAWSLNNSGYQTHEVAERRANGFGLFDVLGNVSEWVNDWYDENYYQNSPRQDPSGPPSGQMRVFRGGSWYDFPGHVRVSHRAASFPGNRWHDYVHGLRCVRD